MKKNTVAVTLLSLLLLLALTHLALGWQESTAKKSRSAEALEAIESEIQTNLAVMKNWNIYKDELKKIVKEYALATEGDADFVIYKTSMSAYLSDEIRFSAKELSVSYREVAFNASKTSGVIEAFEYNTVHELTRIYSLKHEIVDQYDVIRAMVNALDTKPYTQESQDKIFGPIHGIQLALLKLEVLIKSLNEKCEVFLK